MENKDFNGCLLVFKRNTTTKVKQHSELTKEKKENKMIEPCESGKPEEKEDEEDS